jgi:hypothetical protein
MDRPEKIIICVFLTYYYFQMASSFSISDNDASRYAAIESIVERGTLSIDQSTFFNWTNDKIFRDGHYYSDKPLLPTIMGSAVYFITYRFFNISFTNSVFLAIHLIIFFTVGLSSILLMVYFCRALKYANLTDTTRTTLTAALGLATLINSYSIALNSHTISAVFLFASFYYLLKAKFEKNNAGRSLFIAGTLSGATYMIGSIIDVIFPAFFFIYILQEKNLKTRYKYYLIPCTAVLLLGLLSNMLISGGITPSILKPELYQFPGSIAGGPRGALGDKTENPLTYLFNILFGTYGLFILTPILIPSMAVIYRIIKSKKHPFKNEALTITAITITTLIIYAITIPGNYGGLNYGPRRLIPFTPFLLYFTAFIFTSQNKAANWRKFYHLNLIPSLIAAFIPLAIGSPWYIIPPQYMLLLAAYIIITTYLLYLFKPNQPKYTPQSPVG